MAATSNDLLTKFHTWANSYRETFVSRADSAADLSEDKETVQGDVFWEDLSRGVGASVRECAYETATLAQSLVALPLSVLAPFGELYRVASREISFGASLSHMIRLLGHVLFAVFDIIALVGRSLTEVWSGAETGTGFIAWHSGEWLARRASSRPHSVLSQVLAVRSFVYQFIGSPLLALGCVFMPIALVQEMALTVLSVRVFEITNSLLGMQDCPAYYDATAKVIRTNHWLIKPLAAGSESIMKWSEDLLKKTWAETKEAREEYVYAKRASLLQGAESEAPYNIFNARYGRLTGTLEGAITDCDFPAKEPKCFYPHRIPIGQLARWRACWGRERWGMWILGFAGLTTAFLNIALRRRLHLKAILQRY